ncbi:hypothetical protein ACQKWADRAFT_329930 [Trichoderma austrokoningii]
MNGNPFSTGGRVVPDDVSGGLSNQSTNPMANRVDNGLNLFGANGQSNTDGTSPWKVVNYQIPVPIGDCSAHFLIDDTTKKVYKAFLMDGGMNAGRFTAWAQILKGLRWIDLQLGNEWLFDSWVVTHWDADHHRGVKDLFANNEIIFTRCKRVGENTVTKNKSGNFKSLYFQSEPELCCGAWDVKAMFSGGGDFLHPFVKSGSLDEWKNLTTIKDKTGKAQTLLRCLFGQDLIGCDLFTRCRQFNCKTGAPCSAGGNTTLQNFGNQPHVSENTVQDFGNDLQPRFCVVGADGYGIGNPTAYQAKPTRNQTSILALLYWPKQKFCSYYTGGDGHPEVVKEAVQNWFNSRGWEGNQVEMVKLDHHGSTRENLGEVPHKKEELPSESDSNSELEEQEKENEKEKPMRTLESIGLVIRYMKPRRILVTPGSRFGHPTWDVLVALRDHFKTLFEDIINEKGTAQGLFTTRSVYWFSKGKVTLGDINFNHTLTAYFQNRLDLIGIRKPNKMAVEGKQDINNANQGHTKDAIEVETTAANQQEKNNAIEVETIGANQNDTNNANQKNGNNAIEEETANANRQDANDLDQEGTDQDEDYYSDFSDCSLTVEDCSLLDIQSRIEGQNNWEICKTAYFKWLEMSDMKRMLRQTEKGETLTFKFHDKDRNVDSTAINWAIEQDIARCYRKRRKMKRLQYDAFTRNAYTTVREQLLDNLVDAYSELHQNFDTARVASMNDFSKVCWQRIVASAKEDPHYLIRFDFGECREDTVMQVFNDNGRIEYIKQGKKVTENKTNLLAVDEQKPWTKHAFGKWDIATMLAAESRTTPYDAKVGARIKKSSGKNLPGPNKRELKLPDDAERASEDEEPGPGKHGPKQDEKSLEEEKSGSRERKPKRATFIEISSEEDVPQSKNRGSKQAANTKKSLTEEKSRTKKQEPKMTNDMEELPEKKKRGRKKKEVKLADGSEKPSGEEEVDVVLREGQNMVYKYYTKVFEAEKKPGERSTGRRRLGNLIKNEWVVTSKTAESEDEQEVFQPGSEEKVHVPITRAASSRTVEEANGSDAL